jgi:hypothetical protein
MKHAAKWTLSLALGSALAAGLAGAQPAQPADKPQPREQGADSREMPVEPGLAKKFLERRLEETTKREEHLKALLARLDKGESPTDVAKDLADHQGGRDAARHDSAAGAQHNDRPARGKVTPEDREHILKFLHENSPELSARFDKLIKSDPEAADRVLGHMVGRVRDAEAVKESNPALFRLRVQEMEGGAAVVDAMRAFREAKNATPADATRLSQATTQLRVALARQFDLRLSLQENEIEGLTKRLTDLKTDLDKKRSTREEQIDTMLTKVKEGRDQREPRDGPRPDGKAPASVGQAATPNR